MPPLAIVVMGVSGSGKTSVGRALAAALGCRFYEGDDYHPPANVQKMAAGQPLTDADRKPWLAALHGLLLAETTKGALLVLACSALKESYRRQLEGDKLSLRYVFLKGDYDLIVGRMHQRLGHYMPESLLQSQFDALEEPANAIVVDVTKPVDEIVRNILAELSTD
jgi:gluconokinase